MPRSFLNYDRTTRVSGWAMRQTGAQASSLAISINLQPGRLRSSPLTRMALTPALKKSVLELS
jgi:hypothetical protein